MQLDIHDIHLHTLVHESLKQSRPASIMSGQTSLEQLARLRTIGARNSEQVYELADQLLKNGHLGDQGERESDECDMP